MTAWLGEAAEASFMLVAYVVLPVLVPVAVLLLEPRGRRRVALLAVTAAGLNSAWDSAMGLANSAGEAVACDFHIDYEIAGSAPWSGVLYLGATAGALLLSSHRPVWVWGIANAAGIAIFSWWGPHAVPSLWCAWAAVTSFFIAWYLRGLAAAGDTGGPPPWQESAVEPEAAAVGQAAGQPD